MPDGLLGLNCRVLGTSRDIILSGASAIGGAWMLIQDDPALVPMAKAAGFTTLYRQSGDENLSLDAAAFVKTRAEKGASYVYGLNEQDPTPEVLAYTMAQIQAADALGVKLVIGNFATDRSIHQWSDAADVCRYAVEHGHAIGVHSYRKSVSSGADTWWTLKQALGGLWIVTEYGFYVDAYHGWRGVLGPSDYSDFLRGTLSLFEREHMPVLLFSGDNWPASDQGKASGFGVLDNAEMISQLTKVNQEFDLMEPEPVPIPAPVTGGVRASLSSLPGDFVNIRAQPSTGGADVGDLHKGDVGVYYPDYVPTGAAGWVYVAPEGKNAGWVSLQGGAVQFTPVTAPPPDNGVKFTLDQYQQLQAAQAKITDLLTQLTAQKALIDSLLESAATQTTFGSSGGGF